MSKATKLGMAVQRQQQTDKKIRNRRRWKRSVAAVLLLTMTIKDTSVAYAWRSLSSSQPYWNSNNTSEKLYYWELLEDDRTYKDEWSFYEKDGQKYTRMLLCHYKNGWRYYQADPSVWKRDGEFGDNYGFSMRKASDTPQVKIGSKSFVTRGGLQAFWVTKTGECTWSDSDYHGDNQYIFKPCEPGTDRMYDDVSVWWTDGKSYDDIWYYDSKGEPVGNEASKAEWSDKFWFKSGYDGDSVYNKWTVSQNQTLDGLPGFCITAADFKSHDPHFQFWEKDGAYTLSGTDRYWWKADNVTWNIYIGREIKESLATNSGTVNVDSLVAITSPYLIRKGQKYVIGEDGVLFVSDLLLLRGEIVNHGLIIVGNGGLIMELDDEDSTQTLTLDGGDLIVRKQGYISIDQIISQKNNGHCPQILNYGNILASRRLAISNTVLDGSGQLYCGYTLSNFEFVLKNVSNERGKKVERVRLKDGFRLSGVSKDYANGYRGTYIGSGNMLLGNLSYRN